MTHPTIARMQELQSLLSTATMLAIEELETDPVDAPGRVESILAQLPGHWATIVEAVYEGKPPQYCWTERPRKRQTRRPNPAKIHWAQ